MSRKTALAAKYGLTLSRRIICARIVWGGNHERDARVARLQDFRRADRQLTAVARADQLLEPVLNVPSEVVRVAVVDPPVHEPEAVRRADDRIYGQVEDGPPVNAHVGQVAAVSLPGVGEAAFDGSENDFQG